MTTRAELLVRLLKLKTLSEEGIGGELEAAKERLILLMDKYGFHDDDLGNISFYNWKYSQKIESKLLGQVIYSVMGNVKNYRQGKGKNTGIYCTKEDAIEIEAKYGFYRSELQNDLKRFIDAFIIRNRIYPPDSKVETKTSEKPYELTADDRKAFKMSEGLERKDFHKQICGAKK